MGGGKGSQIAHTCRWATHTQVEQPCHSSSTKLCAYGVSKDHIIVEDVQEMGFLILAACSSRNPSSLPPWLHLCKVGCKTLMLFKMERLYFLLCLSRKNSQTNLAVSIRQENKNFHCFLSIVFFSDKAWKLSAKNGDSSRCRPAKAATLKNKSLLEWSGSREDAAKFPLLPKCLPYAPALFKWCQFLYGL